MKNKWKPSLGDKPPRPACKLIKTQSSVAFPIVHSICTADQIKEKRFSSSMWRVLDGMVSHILILFQNLCH